MERVPEFMRECRNRVVTAVEVHHDPTDVAGDTRTVCAALFAVSGLRVDPPLGERATGEPAKIRRVADEHVPHPFGGV